MATHLTVKEKGTGVLWEATYFPEYCGLVRLEIINGPTIHICADALRERFGYWFLADEKDFEEMCKSAEVGYIDLVRLINERNDAIQAALSNVPGPLEQLYLNRALDRHLPETEGDFQ